MIDNLCFPIIIYRFPYNQSQKIAVNFNITDFRKFIFDENDNQQELPDTVLAKCIVIVCDANDFIIHQDSWLDWLRGATTVNTIALNNLKQLWRHQPQSTLILVTNAEKHSTIMQELSECRAITVDRDTNDDKMETIMGWCFSYASAFRGTILK